VRQLVAHKNNSDIQNEYQELFYIGNIFTKTNDDDYFPTESHAKLAALYARDI